MIGQIESFDPETRTGIIKSEEALYPFLLDDWAADVPPESGDDVRFEAEDGNAIQVNLVGAFLEKPKAVKYRLLAAFMALLLGWTGLHRFYLGYYRIGFIQLFLTVILFYAGFIVFIPQWGFVEALLLFSGKFDTDAKGRPLK
ncbi:MAG: NINE protein [Gammaproteobacteria bacterium]